MRRRAQGLQPVIEYGSGPPVDVTSEPLKHSGLPSRAAFQIFVDPFLPAQYPNALIEQPVAASIRGWRDQENDPSEG